MLNNDYITGLVDGEGSFTVYVKNPEENKSSVARRVKAEPRFYIKLIEKDKNILYELKKYFGCGNVYFQKDTRQNHQNCYRYEVANRKDLENIIIPFFKSNRLKFPSKQKDFKIFCDLMAMIKLGKHLTESGLEKMYKLKQAMH
ncbi:LAGLIDADG family homing endonuclease [Candidatus Wolfebacteria bacterium]|nr:LAGLIDADG family homing endonuclease [Candidatus Wolfebacteria bacterium]